MTDKTAEMPGVIYAYHEGTGVNPIYFGLWESDEACFDPAEKRVIYTRTTDLTPIQLSDHIQKWNFTDPASRTFAEYLMAKFPNGIRIVPDDVTGEKEG